MQKLEGKILLCNFSSIIFTVSTCKKNDSVQHQQKNNGVLVKLLKEKYCSVKMWSLWHSSLLHSPHFLFACSKSATVTSLLPVLRVFPLFFPLFFNPLFSYCLQQFSPRGSCITSTQLISSQIINEVHCDCALGEEIELNSREGSS